MKCVKLVLGLSVADVSKWTCGKLQIIRRRVTAMNLKEHNLEELVSVGCEE